MSIDENLMDLADTITTNTNFESNINQKECTIKVHITPEEVSNKVKLVLSTSSIKVNGGISYKVVKRIADIVLSLLAIIVLSPLLLITAFLVFIQDGGSPIFSQTRVTENGRLFKMYKFRSTVNATSSRLTTWKVSATGAASPFYRQNGDCPPSALIGQSIVLSR